MKLSQQFQVELHRKELVDKNPHKNQISPNKILNCKNKSDDSDKEPVT